MAEPSTDDAPEGWRVRQRPAFIAAALVPLTLLACVLLAGWGYDRYLRARHWQAVTTFPAPGVETFVHDGRKDPTRTPPHPAEDPHLTLAKQQVVSQGLENWSARR